MVGVFYYICNPCYTACKLFFSILPCISIQGFLLGVLHLSKMGITLAEINKLNMDRKVISRKNLPVKLPVSFTALVCLILDRFNAASWIWGASLTMLAIIWIGCIVSIITDEEISVV